MGAYNVINRALLQSGQPEDISQIVSNLDAIASVLNGGIDNTNVAAGAAIDYSKIAVPAGAIALSKLVPGSNLQSLYTIANAVAWGVRGADITAAATITVTNPQHRVLTGVTISTINGGVDGGVVTLIAPTGNTFTISSAGNVWATPSGGSITIPANGAVTLVYNTANTAWYVVSPPASGTTTPYALIQDQVAAGTLCQAAATGAWTQRRLQTIARDANSIIVSLTSNQFTLAAGTYRINARAPAYQCNRTTSRLRNITDGADTLIGSPSFSPVNASEVTSWIRGEFVLAAQKTFEIQQWLDTANDTSHAFGIEGSHGVVEIYTQVELLKVA